MGTLKRIDSNPGLVEQVHRQLLEAICAGHLAPGARVRQEQVAASLGVSRQPVHQALRLLKNEGFLVEAGRRGLMVAPLESAAVDQLYEVRSVLDGLAARLAARSGAQLDPALISAGRRSLKGPLLGAILADLRFHQAVYAASGNALLAESAGRYWQHISRAMGAALGPHGLGPSVWDEHDDILRAINKGEAARAEALARGHCEQAGRVLSGRLQPDKREEKSA